MNKNMKITLVFLGIIFLGGFIVLANQEPPLTEDVINGEDTITKEESKNEEVKGNTTDAFIQCLKEKGVVIYGSEWCPYCKNLAESLGGYEMVDPIYVECTIEEKRCMNEMIGRSVPEIQIEGEMYRGSRDPERLAEATGCTY